MKTHPTRSTTGSSGFTLVELLVTIVIIATLAALTMMGFSRMRAAGDRATTITVMRQLQIANTGYAAENGGKYVPIAEVDPSSGQLVMEWYKNPKFLIHLYGDPTVFEKTGGELLTAPVGSLDPVAYRAKKRDYDRITASFGINGEGQSWPNLSNPQPSLTVSQVHNPGRTAFLSTAVNYQFRHSGRNLWKQAPVEGKVTTDKMAFRHGGKAIIVYYDGSSGLIGYEDIARFDANGGATNPFWRALR